MSCPSRVRLIFYASRGGIDTILDDVGVVDADLRAVVSAAAAVFMGDQDDQDVNADTTTLMNVLDACRAEQRRRNPPGKAPPACGTLSRNP